MQVKLFILCTFSALVTSTFNVNGQKINNQKSAIAEKSTYLADISSLLKQKWPNNRIINIVCHGHSVPAGYFKTPNINTFGAYPFLFHQGLKNKFPFAEINVIVTAIGGENSEQGEKRFGQDVLCCSPDLILIDYALNDRSIGLKRAKKAWKSMIEKALAKGIKVILLTPTGDKSVDINDPKDPLSRHAEQIRDLAREYHVGLVDSYATFQKYVNDGGSLDDLMAQVNHPNKKGHELVVEQLLQWIPE